MLTSLIVSIQHSISIFLKTNVHFLNPSTVTLLSHQSNSIYTRIYPLILHHCWIRILQPTIIILSLRYRIPYLRNMITVVEFRKRTDISWKEDHTIQEKSLQVRKNGFNNKKSRQFSSFEVFLNLKSFPYF